MPNMLFPQFGSTAHPSYVGLAQRCLQHDPHKRPSFTEITGALQTFFDEQVYPCSTASVPPQPAPPSLGSDGTVSENIPPPAYAAATGSHSNCDGLVEYFPVSYCDGRSLLASSLLPGADPHLLHLEVQALEGQQQQQQQGTCSRRLGPGPRTGESG